VLSSALERAGFRVERIPTEAELSSPRNGQWVRRAGRKLLNGLAMDEYEARAAWALRGWQPQGSGALLIGYPFSPLYHAARGLANAGVPYVVDVGDPWALTSSMPPCGRLCARRARAAERFIWSHAAGGIVTTEQQAAAIGSLFRGLPLLSRPNGFAEPPTLPQARPAVDGDRRELRLVHFGTLYGPRLSPFDWLSRLRAEAGVERIRFVNYGYVDEADWLDLEDPAISVELRAPVAWEEARRAAAEFDGAVVIGNTDPSQLPSKAVKYLTLPVPRLALSDGGGDELTAFARSKPGFLGVDLGSAADLARTIDHLRRAWSAAELMPPSADSWPEVERAVVEFLTECWQGTPDAMPGSG
jgi:hypothetical protein